MPPKRSQPAAPAEPDIPVDQPTTPVFDAAKAILELQTTTNARLDQLTALLSSQHDALTGALELAAASVKPEFFKDNPVFSPAKATSTEAPATSGTPQSAPGSGSTSADKGKEPPLPETAPTSHKVRPQVPKAKAPPEFFGLPYEVDPDKQKESVQQWILHMERYHATFPTLTDTEKVTDAVLSLRGSAIAWWTTQETLDNQEVQTSWAGFTKGLRARFLPANVEELSRDFLASAVRQGTRTVAEYVDYFLKVVLNIPKMDPDDKTSAFRRGLRAEITQLLRIQGDAPTSLEKLIRDARHIENIAIPKRITPAVIAPTVAPIAPVTPPRRQDFVPSAQRARYRPHQNRQQGYYGPPPLHFGMMQPTPYWTPPFAGQGPAMPHMMPGQGPAMPPFAGQGPAMPPGQGPPIPFMAAQHQVMAQQQPAQSTPVQRSQQRSSQQHSVAHPTDMNGVRCFNCRENGHYARDCPLPKNERRQ